MGAPRVVNGLGGVGRTHGVWRAWGSSLGRRLDHRQNPGLQRIRQARPCVDNLGKIGVDFRAVSAKGAASDIGGIAASVVITKGLRICVTGFRDRPIQSLWHLSTCGTERGSLRDISSYFQPFRRHCGFLGLSDIDLPHARSWSGQVMEMATSMNFWITSIFVVV